MRSGLIVCLLLPQLVFAQIDSLDIKIGQMIIMGLDNFNELNTSEPMLEVIEEGKLGNLILYTKHINPSDPVRSLQEITKYLQEISPIPLFIGIDEEGGRVNRLKERYGFPATASAQYLGSLESRDSTIRYANSTGEVLSRLGINMNFAPNVDVNVNPSNPVIGSKERSYSSDPDVVAQQAHWVMQAQRRHGVVNVIKHFPGHGSSTADTHLGMADVSDSWVIEELYPFGNLINYSQVDAVMTAHIVNEKLDESRLPATLSRRIVTDLLRGFMGYDGIVISDDMQMHAISQHYGFEEAIVLSINAGVDMLMFANNTALADRVEPEDIHAMIKRNVLNGNIPEARIEESFDRIMKVKRSFL